MNGSILCLSERRTCFSFPVVDDSSVSPIEKLCGNVHFFDGLPGHMLVQAFLIATLYVGEIV